MPAPQSQPAATQSTPEAGTTRRHPPVPAPPGRLFGRDADIAALTRMLLDDDVRLVTLTGPGGVGKTRLALGLAGRAADHFSGNVTYVGLSSLAEPTRVLPEIAHALGLPDAAGAMVERQLIAGLQGAPHLLILDNFEHVVAAGPAVGELVRHCPLLTLLITSRLRLRLQGEHEYQVAPLPLPEPVPSDKADPATLGANPAVALFVQRAIAARPGFALTSANAAEVAQLCRRLDGLPLAIELAAARSAVLSPKSMLARLSGRLQLLSDGPVDAPPRLRTMRDAVAWSLDLLTPEAADLFRRVGVFAATFSVESVEAIAGEIPTLPALGALIDAALLIPAPGGDDTTRYRMLEPIREVARERLDDAGETDEVNLLLAKHFIRVIDEATPAIRAGEHDPWFAILEAEQDNLRATIDWAIRAGRADLALGLMVGPLWFLWSIRGRIRGERRRLEEALALAPGAEPPVEPGLWARALFTDALYCMDTGDISRARERFESSLAVCKKLPGGENLSLTVLSNLAMLDNDQGRYADARARLEDVLEIRRRSGAPADISSTLVNLGNTANMQEDFATATRCLEEALPLLRQTGDRRNLAYCLNNLGETAAGRDLDAEALVSFDQALGLFRQVGDLTGEGVALANLAAAALRTGDVPRAAAALAEVLEQQREAKTPVVVADALNGAAAVVLAAGQVRLAPEFLAVAAGIRAATQTVPSPAVRRRSERAIGAAKAALGRAAFDRITRSARTLTVDEAIAHAALVLGDLAPGSVTDGDGPLELVPRRLATASTPVALTKRQREVLRLLVAGSTDPEIADALGIGVRTVESHVAAILDKLRVHARTAAVAYAVRHGLG